MLDLNKKTVANLSNQEMQNVNGGLCVKSTKKECTWKLDIKITLEV
ncbi:class I lanthipeptide [Aquimarina celericrescens]|nr:class I lanthipeptide [Aquimarina celericrescens]